MVSDLSECHSQFNGFNVAVRLFSNRSQMTSKCGKNKNVAHEMIAKFVLKCSHHILTSSVIYYWIDARQRGIYLFYNVKKQKNGNDVICASVLLWIISKNQSKYEKNLTYHMKNCFVNLCLMWFIPMLGVWKSRDELKAIRCSQALFQPKASIRDKYLKNFDEWGEALHRSKNWYK